MPEWDLTPLKHADLDICDFPRARDALVRAGADVVVNTAAFHRVDDCEDQWENAFQVN
jgi:dTDP-4-dehydrorhamnose reductase